MSSTLPANAECFQAPDRDNPHYASACGGIVNPRYRLLPEGTRLYRFGHSVDRRTGNNVPKAINHTSPWWFGTEDFAGFLARPGSPPSRAGFVLPASEADGGKPGGFDSYGFNAMVRARLAVVHQFGQADRIIAARLTAPLGCFAGPGKPIVEDPATGALRPLVTEGLMVWSADPTMTQFYIPGLRATGATRSAIAAAALRIEKDFPAHEFFLW